MPETDASTPIKVLNVPITKAKTTLAVNLDELPDDVYMEAMLQGLKVLLNRGASKITKETYPAADELKSAALTKANEQLEMVKTSKIKFTGGKKKSSVSGKVMTRARQMARNLVKQELRANGIKPAHVEAAEITKWANAYLDSEKGPDLIAKAKAAIEAEESEGVGGVIDVSAVAISPKLVAAAEAKKAKSGTLSAKQAGKVKARAKGEAQATAH